jgi:hypothetical protein
MVGRKTKLSNLEQELPEGLLIDAHWLTQRGYSRQLWNHYVATGRLEQPAPRVFRRPRGKLTWEQVVISLQTLLGYVVVVGGRTALEFEGYGHYVPRRVGKIHLYGSDRPPAWLHNLRLDVVFRWHNDQRLFRSEALPQSLSGLDEQKQSGPADDDRARVGLTVQRWGQWDWPLTLSSPERAILELLDELPARESFEQVDKLIEGLSNLRPQRLQKLLADCRSIKVKRLFFFFADRHNHAWLKRLDKSQIDLGKGKRVLVKGGRLDPVYQITVPEDLDAVR